MESTMWWTLAVLAGVGIIAIIFGITVLLSLWWLFVPLAGAFLGGWFGLFCGIGVVILLGAFLRVLKKKK